MEVVKVEVLDLHENGRFELCPPVLVIKAGERRLGIVNFRNNMEQTIKTILNNQCGTHVSGFTGKTELLDKFKNMTLDFYGCYGA